MASLSHGNPRCNVFNKSEAMSSVGGVTTFPYFQPMACAVESCFTGRSPFQSLHVKEASAFPRNKSYCMISKKLNLTITGSSNSPESSSSKDDSSDKAKVPFGYSRKDVIFIGLGVTVLGVGLKSGLEYVGVDPLQAGNVVQLVLVLGLTIGWISTYIFRVSNKEMTYAQQLRDYESQVMQKRLEGLTEAELEALLEQVEEDKRRFVSDEQVK